MKRVIHPAGHRIKVKLCDTQKETVSEGGIIIETDINYEARRYATTEAVVVEIGMTAYKGFDEGLPWCEVGQTVLIAKYAGENRVDEKTGEIYRIINDADVSAYFTEEEE